MHVQFMLTGSMPQAQQRYRTARLYPRPTGRGFTRIFAKRSQQTQLGHTQPGKYRFM